MAKKRSPKRQPSPIAPAAADNAALHIMDGVFINAVGTTFSGKLADFGAGRSGRLALHFDHALTGICRHGVELRLARDAADPAVLYGKIGDTDENAFVIAASADGSYTFEQLARFDAVKLTEILRLGSDAAGRLAGAGYEAGRMSPVFFLTRAGVWDLTGSAPANDWIVAVAATRNDLPDANVTRESQGFGTEYGQLDFHNSLLFTVNTTGSAPALVSAMSFSIFGLFKAHGGSPPEYLYCTVQYCDAAGKILDRRTLPRHEVRGASANRARPQRYDVPVPDGCFIASVAFNDAIKYYRACEINLAALTCFYAAPDKDCRIPDLRFGFTATDDAGRQVSGTVGLAIDPQDLKGLYAGAAANAGFPRQRESGPQNAPDNPRFEDLFETQEELELLVEMATWDGASRAFVRAGHDKKAAGLDIQFLKDIGSALQAAAPGKAGEGKK